MDVKYDRIVSVCIQDSFIHNIRTIVKYHDYNSISEFFRVAAINELKRLGYDIEEEK